MATRSMLITWETFGNLKIRDFNRKWHDRVIKYMLEHDYYNNRFYNALDMYQNPDNEVMYQRYLKQILRYDCCLVVVDDEEDEIHGVAIATWMSKDWYSWSDFGTIQINCELSQFHNFLRSLHYNYHRKRKSTNLFNSFHLFEYHLRADLHESDEFMTKFFDVICNVAAHMKMPRVTFFGKCEAEHKDMMRARFRVLNESIYSLYVENGLRPFAKLRDIEEMFAIYYDKPVVPIIPYTLLPGFEEILAAMEAARLKELQREQENN